MNQTTQAPYTPWWDSYDHAQASPNYDTAHAYQDLLGRMPEHQGTNPHDAIHGVIGMDGIRRNILASNEYTGRLLGAPESFAQDMGRRAVSGINAMPGVFSDYTNPNLPNQHHNMGVQRAAAQQMYPDAFQALLGAFVPTPEPEIPSAIQQLLSGPATPEPEPQPKKKKDEEREGNFWGANPMDHTR